MSSIPQYYQLKLCLTKNKDEEEIYSVLLDKREQHGIPAKELSTLLNRVRTGAWVGNPQEGFLVGRELFNQLNRSGGLSKLLGEVSKQKTIELYVDIPDELSALPVELLAKEQDFLHNQYPLQIIRGTHDKQEQWEVEQRPLKVLFMASSPIDSNNSTLAFEKEEEAIQQAVEKWPVDLTIEDMGSLSGLEEKIKQDKGYDIVHLSGHAVVHHEHGPVFCMEDDEGQECLVKPSELYDALESFPPKMLFLSGCETGKADKLNGHASFARQMVEAGIPNVLGWEFSVGDAGATIIASAIYEYIAIGKTLNEALKHCRNLKQGTFYSTWSILRLHSNGASADQHLVVTNNRKSFAQKTGASKKLIGKKVEVLDKGFVGRRRAIQTGLKSLRGDEFYGYIIQGPAGQGKSCLASKLIDRLKKDRFPDLLVFKGVIRPEDVSAELEELFREPKWQQAREILKTEKELGFEQMIQSLFSTVFKEHPTIWYFDDFEDNLEQQGEQFLLRPELIEVFPAILSSVDLAHGCSKLLITSRHPFSFERNGRDRAQECLQRGPLDSMKGADLQKKLAQLKKVHQSQHRDTLFEQIETLSGGNPRAIDWLYEVIENNVADLNELKLKLKGKKAEFIQTYLAELIAQHEGSEFEQFLSCLSVWAEPVPQTAIENVFDCSERLLTRGVDLTLIEESNGKPGEKLHMVHPLLRNSYWEKVEKQKQTQLHQKAMCWYEQKIEDEQADFSDHRQALHHSLAISDLKHACQYTCFIGNHLHEVALFNDSDDVFQTTWLLLSESDTPEEQFNDQTCYSGFLNDFATLLQATNRMEQAEPLMKRALEIDERSLGKDHPKVAGDLNNLASLLQATNRMEQAEPLMKRALEIDERSFGKDHPTVAIDLNNFAQLLKATNRMEQAEPLMKRVLKILGDFSIKTGHLHPHLLAVVKNYVILLTEMKVDGEYFWKNITEASGFSPEQIQQIMGWDKEES